VRTNVKGLVDRLELSPARGMMPLFEAISNAIDAIEACKDGFLTHAIAVKMIRANDLALQGGDDSFNVDGFDVTDDGIGFDDDNLESFQEAHTLSKIKLGGKGVGRFTFLKVFKKVSITSRYKKNNQKYCRKFEFSIDKEVDPNEITLLTNDVTGTTLSVREIEPKYRSGWPLTPEGIAEKIIAHFLIRFASRSIPKVILNFEGHSSINLQEMFEQTVIAQIKEVSFCVRGHTFTLQAYRHRTGRSRHDLHFCANGREVQTNKLRDLLPELPEKFLDPDQTPYTLIVLVTGEYLDVHANQERTRIAFESEDEQDFDTNHVSSYALNRGIAVTLRPLLVEELKETHQEKRLQIEKFVEDAPEYRALTQPRYSQLLEERIQPGLSDDKLDEALLHVKREIEDGVRKDLRSVAAHFESESSEQYPEYFNALFDKVNELSHAELAKYVTHRRTILDLLSGSLKKQRSDQKYPLERVLHKMIFPMGTTSKHIFLEQQNLWVIDERLCFHTLLTSDKRLNSIKGLEDTSAKEPDICAFFYDTPIGIREQDDSTGAIVVIEFKRPGRDDYQADPAQQIIKRFVEIQESKLADIDGRPINPRGIRFFGYLIADLMPTLRREMNFNYIESIDGEGYFRTLPGKNEGYVEIISYDKLLKDAARRNRVLFDKLGLHKHIN
jgi:hypothetical protein